MEKVRQIYSDSNIQSMKTNNTEGSIEHLLPKFLLSDLYDKNDSTHFITESSKDYNLDNNFSYLDVCDFPEEIDPILEDFNLKEVIQYNNFLF